MKTITKIFSVLLLASLIVNAGCKKYEEGPAISLRSKKARLTGQWKIDKATDLEDGSDITADFAGEIWEFTKDEEYKENANLKGIWNFSDDKEELIITKINGNSKLYKILKLKENDLWLEKLAEEKIYLTKY